MSAILDTTTILLRNDNHYNIIYWLLIIINYNKNLNLSIIGYLVLIIILLIMPISSCISDQTMVPLRIPTPKCAYSVESCERCPNGRYGLYCDMSS